MSLSVGVLSAAHVHTDEYAAILAEMDDVEFVGVADDDAERGRATAERHATEYLPRDDLLAEIDAGVVCATNANHRDWVDSAAEAGVHILCEKPLAPTVEEATAIVERCEEAGVELGVAMPLRFSEPARRARDALTRGDAGNVHSISGTNRGQMPGGWFTDPDAAGGGAVMDHTVHIVDLVYHLTGQEVVEVYAESGTRFHDIPVDDVNVLSMELADGSQFLLDGSWSKPDEWHTWGDATVELVGTEGTISVDCFDQKLTYTTDSGEDAGVNAVFWGTDPNVALVEDFVNAVRNGRSPKITGEEGVLAVAVVEAAYESHRENEPVAVDY
jgi:predicted dehydrogenase